MKRILVIDDEPDCADTLAELLLLNGHEVQVAYSGREALHIVEEWRPDAVICDLAMPEMDGYTLCGRLRQDPRFGQIRFVAVSGYADPRFAERSRQAGYSAHICKPMDPGELERLLGE